MVCVRSDSTTDDYGAFAVTPRVFAYGVLREGAVLIEPPNVRLTCAAGRFDRWQWHHTTVQDAHEKRTKFETAPTVSGAGCVGPRVLEATGMIVPWADVDERAGKKGLFGNFRG